MKIPLGLYDLVMDRDLAQAVGALDPSVFLVVAAFDFRNWRDSKRQGDMGFNPRLLFIAHREEILKQSLATFRAVTRDANFGDLMVGGHPSGGTGVHLPVAPPRQLHARRVTGRSRPLDAAEPA